MMKAIHTLFIALALSAMCSLFTACSNDCEPQWNPENSEEENRPAVGDGQFIVSYNAADGSSTRALSDTPVPAAQRISSLHYYVYDKLTGNLIKKRQIRGINEQTKWPITNRSEMPWELRQDLQDTLMAGPTYRILFIANIDSTLFTLRDGTPHPSVVRHDEKYESARILLPQVSFTDRNMYYLWEGELVAQSQTTVKRQDVLLRRLVTRTDVERMVIPDLGKHLEQVIDDCLYNDEDIHTKVDAHIASFCNRMTERMTGDYKPKAAEFRIFLNRKGIKDSIKTELKRKVVGQYKTAILSNETVISQAHEWPIKGTVTIHYQNGTRANVLTFSLTPEKDSNWEQTEEIEVTNGKFSIIGFSGDEPTKTNGVEKIVFSGIEPTSSFHITNETLWLKDGMNKRYKVICNPVNKITGSDTFPQYSPIVNIDSLLSTNEQWKHFKTFDLGKFGGTFFENVQSKVFDGKSGVGTDYTKYGAHFNEFLFSNISMPNINDGNVKDIALIPSWNYIPDSPQI